MYVHEDKNTNMRTLLLLKVIAMKKLKSSEVASLLGVGLDTVRAWRHGKFAVPEEKLRKLYKELGIEWEGLA